MAQANAQPTPQHPGNDVAATWIPGADLGVSDRHMRRLAERLKPLGQARKLGQSWHFDPAVHEIRALLAPNRDREGAAPTLAGLSTAQIDRARAWVRIIEEGRRQVRQRMADTGAGRTVCLEWFVKDWFPSSPLSAKHEGRLTVRTFQRRDARYDRHPNKILTQVDSRGRPAGAAVTMPPAAWDYFLSLWLHENRRSKKLCFELVADRAREVGWELPGYATFVRRANALPRSVVVRGREGDRAYKMQCEPKMQRSREHLPSNYVWCGDEHVFDIHCRQQDGSGQWKRVRPILTAWLDERSRVFVGWHIDRRANTDSILAAFRMGVEKYGPPCAVHIDNGTDYKASANRKKHKRWVDFDQSRLAGLYGELDIDVHWAIPYQPWAKMIESHFRPVCDTFSKLFDVGYCGGSPQARPEGAAKIPIHKLPTIDEVRQRFAEWLDAHHARTTTIAELYGLTPAQAMVQFRGPVKREVPAGYLLDHLCARVAGPITVTRNGVRWMGVYYGQGNDDLYKLLGREVQLRIQPDRADFVDVCDLQGRMITRATQQRLTGATQEDMREAGRRRKKSRAIVKQAHETARDQLHTPVSGAIAAMARRNRAKQAEVDPPTEPQRVKLTRPDLRESVERAIVEPRSDAGRRRSERGSNTIDWAAVNANLGFGAGPGEPLDDEIESTGPSAEDILTTGRIDGPGEDTEEDSPARDAFDVIRSARHAG